MSSSGSTGKLSAEAQRHAVRQAESVYGLSNSASPAAPAAQFAGGILLTLVVVVPFTIMNWLFEVYGVDGIVLITLTLGVIAVRMASLAVYALVQRQPNVHWETWSITICTWFTTASISIAVQYALRIATTLWTRHYDNMNIVYAIVIFAAFLFFSFAAVQRLRMDVARSARRERALYQQYHLRM